MFVPNPRARLPGVPINGGARRIVRDEEMSALERAMQTHIRIERLPEPEQEYRFDSTRRWKFDFAWPALMLAVEVEGGTFSGGRHTRGTGYAADCEKYNAAAIAGWRVLRFTGGMVTSGVAIVTLCRAMNAAEAKS